MARPAPSLDSVFSFGAKASDSEPTEQQQQQHAREEEDGASVDSGDDSFEFAFAQPLVGAAGQHADAALADDIFAHGRILPAYPVFDRRLLVQQEPSSSSTAQPEPEPEPDTYCAWAPRSAPGSPARDFPKSASTGEPRRLRLRDVLVGSSGRSHSDGKEKFFFLHPSPTPKAATAAEDKRTKKAPVTPSPTQQQKQQGGSGKKKGAVTEMDMATAHRLFYSKTGAAAVGGGERKQQTSYLTYRPAFVGFFAGAHAIGRSHHHLTSQANPWMKNY